MLRKRALIIFDTLKKCWKSVRRKDMRGGLTVCAIALLFLDTLKGKLKLLIYCE